MEWFLTKIVFRIVCGDGDHTPQFDEQLRIIQADSKEDAFHKAITIGQQEEDCFPNSEHKPVHWHFINVSEIYPISDIVDGAEVYSRIEEKEDGEGYTDIVNRKAAWLAAAVNRQTLQIA